MRTRGQPNRRFCARRGPHSTRQRRSESRSCATGTAGAQGDQDGRPRSARRGGRGQHRPSGPARARGAFPARQTTRATASTLTNASPRGIGQIRQAAKDMPASGRALPPPAVRLDRAQRGLDRSLCQCREDGGGPPDGRVARPTLRPFAYVMMDAKERRRATRDARGATAHPKAVPLRAAPRRSDCRPPARHQGRPARGRTTASPAAPGAAAARAGW